jgi:hypothetical protein
MWYFLPKSKEAMCCAARYVHLIPARGSEVPGRLARATLGVNDLGKGILVEIVIAAAAG